MHNRLKCAAALAAALLTGSATAATPTFSKDVAPVIYNNCVSCHRPNEIAPMSLLTYKEARPWARSIREYVVRGQMPPWHATQPQGTFSNDRRLTDADKETLIAWVDGGAPEGDPKDLPAVPKFADGWQIGKPDVVLSMAKPFDVPPNGTVDYQYFTVPTNFTEDKWVQAVEIRPSVRSVVHHIIVYMKEPVGARVETGFSQVLPSMPGGNRGNQQGGPGVMLCAMAPGTPPMVFKPGEALKIPAGTSLIFQIHYTANGKGAMDQSSIGLVFAKEPPEREIHTAAFFNPFMRIPAGVADKAIDSAIQFTEDAHITGLIPHTHLRGKSWQYRLVYPDGTSKIILSVPHYDFNWQTYYTFAKALAVPKGSLLEATADYDNSVNNSANPNPKVDVRWGDQTWNEMQYTAMTYFIDHPAAPETSARK